MHIPAKLRAFAKRANAQRWVDALPARVKRLAHEWDLEVGTAYPDCGVSYVAPATQVGTPVVLKVQWPHEECRYEADALKVWDGQGAVRLLAADAEHQAMLLERCEPGLHLTGAGIDDAMSVMTELLPMLWKPAGPPFRSLSAEAAGWQASLQLSGQANLAGGDLSLLDAASAIIDELAHSQGEQVLVHQDLHGDNLLSATRAAWLAIDPKPLVGEREFGLSPIIRSIELGATKADLLHRLDRLTETFSLNRERACGWAIVQSVAWSLGSDNAAQQQQLASWLLAAR